MPAACRRLARCLFWLLALALLMGRTLPAAAQDAESTPEAPSPTAPIPTPAPEAVPLTAGEATDGRVSPTTPIAVYSFEAGDSDLVLQMESSTPSNASVLVYEASSGHVLALISLRLPAWRINIPPGNGRYAVNITHSGSAVEETYTITLLELPALPLEDRVATVQAYELALSSPTPSVTPTPTTTPTPEATATPTATEPLGVATLTPTEEGATRSAATPTFTLIPNLTPTEIQPFALTPLPAAGPCVLAPIEDELVNVRGAPSTDAPVVTRLAPNTTAPVTGRTDDSLWYQVNVNGVSGWVFRDVARFGGDCNAVLPAGTSGGVPPAPVPAPDVQPGAPAPDLVVIGVTASQPLAPGAPFTVNVAVANMGSRAAGAFSVSATFPPSLVISTADVGGLAPGETVIVAIPAAGYTAPGDYVVPVFADSNRQIAESDEGNNRSSASFRVG